jgi:hypothetical protein
MLRRSSILALLVFGSLAAHADSLLIQGSIGIDDLHPTILFTVQAPEVVTIQSFGYAGGTVNGVTIPEGGFDPNAFVFDYNTGLLTAEDNGANCITGHDSVTGNCDDPYIQESFAPGLYALVIVVANNSRNGNLADGFTEDGAGSFTCQLYGITGNFCDLSTATGTPRTGNWAVAITGADSAQLAPEPTTSISFAVAVVALTLRRSHASGKPVN